MTSGSARGSSPRTVITFAPATRAVVTAAVVAASLFPAGTSSARWSSGAGALVAGSRAGLVTTRMPGSWAASTFAGIPTASTTRGSRALIRAWSAALITAAAAWAEPEAGRTPVCRAIVAAPPDPGCAGAAEVSSMGAWRCSAWRAAAASADLSGLAITMTGADANNSCATPSAITSGVPVSTEVAAAGSRVCEASGAGAGGSCSGHAGAGCHAGANGSQQREHRPGFEQLPAAALTGLQPPHTASGRHERTPFVICSRRLQQGAVPVQKRGA